MLTYLDCVQGRHPLKVGGMRLHAAHPGKDVRLSPLLTKEVREPLQILGGCEANGVDSIREPHHAQTVQLFIKKGRSKLLRQSRDVLYDSEAHPPFVVLR